VQDTLFERSIRAFRQDHRSAREQLASLRRMGRLLSVVLFSLILGYFATLAYNVSVDLAPERFEAPFEAQALRLLPMLEPELRELWQETAAAYADPRLRDALPQLTATARRELELMHAGLAASADRRLRLALTRLAESPPSALLERVREESGEAEAARVEREWPAQAAPALASIAPQFIGLYEQDLSRLRSVMSEFDGNAYSFMQDERLAQQLIHLWLAKVERPRAGAP